MLEASNRGLELYLFWRGLHAFLDAPAQLCLIVVRQSESAEPCQHLALEHTRINETAAPPAHKRLMDIGRYSVDWRAAHKLAGMRAREHRHEQVTALVLADMRPLVALARQDRSLRELVTPDQPHAVQRA